MPDTFKKPPYNIPILEILKKHSSKDRPMTQSEIIEKLESEYELAQAPDTIRKTVRRNLKKLVDAGYPVRKIPKPNIKLTEGNVPQANQYNWYYDRESVSDEDGFEASELRFLLDSVVSSNQIPPGTMRKDLLKKIAALGKEETQHYARILESIDIHYGAKSKKKSNRELFLTIETIDEAIKAGRTIEFNYNHFAADGKLYPRKNKAGKVMVYLVHPYFIVNHASRYFLIGQSEGFDNLSYYRIDRMTNVAEGVKASRISTSQLSVEQSSERLAAFTDNNVSLYISDNEPIKLRVPKDYLDPIFDDFPSATLISSDNDTVIASFHANEKAMVSWIMKHCGTIEVLEPKKLRDDLFQTACAIVEQYKALQ